MYDDGDWQFRPQHPGAPITHVPGPEHVCRLASVGFVPPSPLLEPPLLLVLLLPPDDEAPPSPPKSGDAVEPPHAIRTKATNAQEVKARIISIVAHTHLSGVTAARAIHA